MSRLLKVFGYALKLTVAYVSAVFAILFDSSKRNVWIISERGNDARDNGYFFYKYMIEIHPETKVFYVIQSTSSDARRIRPQDLIETNSFKHFLYFALCKVRISSHAWGGDIPCADYYRKLGLYKHTHKKVVFLQHGIIKDFLPSLCYPIIRPDIFVCGAEPEWHYIHDNFKHPEGVVLYTGLARYDSLNEYKTKDQILLMPTFRKFLQGLSEEDFVKEDYYIQWQALLDSPRLIALAEETGLDIVFYPHYEMQKYVHLFHSSSDRVKIADFEHYDVQTLLKESKLMITDFSSVFFDFSYMRKPIVFYHFDRERYLKEHYDFTKGYFDYDTMAPGKVVFDESEALHEISRIVETGFVVDKEYVVRRNRFFAKSDQHNCDRIFEAINYLQHF